MNISLCVVFAQGGILFPRCICWIKHNIPFYEPSEQRTTTNKVQWINFPFCQYRAPPCTLPEALEQCKSTYNGASNIILCFPTEKALRAFEASASAKASQKNRALSRSILLTLCNGSNSTFVLPFYKKLLFFVSLNIISFFCFVSFFRITMRVYRDSYGNVFCCMEWFD